MVVSNTIFANFISNPLHFMKIATVAISLFTLSIGHQLATASSLEVVNVTASRLPSLQQNFASSLSVISSGQLNTVSHTHIYEALTRAPGVWASRGNGQEHLTAIRSPVLTGAGSCGAFYIAEDGIPVRSNGFCNVNQLFDINTEQANRIEVLRGPGNALHGSGAMHGVINIISQAPANKLEHRLSLEAGPHSYSRIKYSNSNTISKNAYRISINATHDDGYKDDSGFDQQKLTARHDHIDDQLSINSLLSFSNVNQETAGFVSGFETYKDNSLRKSNPFPEAFRDSQSTRFQSKITQQHDNNSLVITPYVRYTDMRFLMHFLPGQPVEENGQKSVGIQSAYIQSASDLLTFTQGFDIEFTDAWLKQTQFQDANVALAGKQYDYDVFAQTYAAFLQSDYQLTSSTRISAGLRYEYIHYDYDNRMISGDNNADGSNCINSFTNLPASCRYTRPEDRKDNFDNISYTAEFIHQLTTTMQITGRFAQGFRAPQATELYRLQAGQLIADIDPEKIDSLELGIRGNYSILQYTIAGFHMEKSNVIFQSSNRLNLDNGETEHYGIEYDLKLPINNQLTIALSGTLTRQKYSNNVSSPGPRSRSIIPTDGNDIDTAPRRLSSLIINWQPNQQINTELEWLAMGKYYTDINNQNSYEGHNLLNLRVNYKPNQQTQIGLRINNLNNTKYADRADFSSFGGDRYFIGEERSVYVSADFIF